MISQVSSCYSYCPRPLMQHSKWFTVFIIHHFTTVGFTVEFISPLQYLIQHDSSAEWTSFSGDQLCYLSPLAPLSLSCPTFSVLPHYLHFALLSLSCSIISFVRIISVMPYYLCLALLSLSCPFILSLCLSYYFCLVPLSLEMCKYLS